MIEIILGVLCVLVLWAIDICWATFKMTRHIANELEKNKVTEPERPLTFAEFCKSIEKEEN